MKIAACLKWVDLRPEIDAFTGAVHTDARWFGHSPADEAALEWALRLAEATGGSVTAVTAGPVVSEAGLRAAVAAGAAEAARVDMDDAWPSHDVARGLAAATAGADVVVCGDWSLDRGSGSVPAFLAHELGAAQALGLVALDLSRPDDLRVTRRLDGGRREHLAVRPTTVLSVDGGSASLRRAPLAGVLAAETIEVATVAAPSSTGVPSVRLERRRPFAPRARVVAPPGGDDVRARVLSATGALVDRDPPRRLELDPVAAAEVVHQQLRDWGYLE